MTMNTKFEVQSIFVDDKRNSSDQSEKTNILDQAAPENVYTFYLIENG